MHSIVPTLRVFCSIELSSMRLRVTSIYNWLAKAKVKQRGKGLLTLKRSKGKGRPRTLSSAQDES